MNKTIKYSAIVIASFIAFCSCATRSRDIVSENVENAVAQYKELLKTAEADDTIRIPSSYKNDTVEFVPVYDWVSGFFAGSLWYIYELTGDEYWAEKARKHTEILDSVKYLTTNHDVGFMIYDSYGNGLRLKNIDGYRDVCVTAAKSLSTRFRKEAGIIQSWDVEQGWQSQRGWKCPVIIDNMMNLELLFKATQFTGDSTYYDIAVSHAEHTMKNHFRPDYSCYHVVDYDSETGDVRGKYTAQGYSDESSWARGQAWALYGFSTVYKYTGEKKFLEHAEHVADFIFNNPNMPEDLVPYWDFDAPDIPDTYRDVSSAAVMASALYELYVQAQNVSYREKADKIIESLSSPAYRAGYGTNGNFILMHSVGSVPHGAGIDVPLNYADYYFLEALVRKSAVDKLEN